MTLTRSIDRMLSMLVLTTIVRTLIVPTPAAAAAAFLAPLDANIRITDTGEVLKTEHPRFATVGGVALISPAMPVTEKSQIPVATVRRTYAAHATVQVAPRRAPTPVGATFRVQATAYSSTPDQTDASPFITASGTHVHDGTIASNFLPFGTKVKFPDYSGDKTYVVEDRTARRFSDRADIWMTSRGAAMSFGRQSLTMVVVE
jgi:3D (Asp-Asp-Asp) domain-containing protein